MNNKYTYEDLQNYLNYMNEQLETLIEVDRMEQLGFGNNHYVQAEKKFALKEFKETLKEINKEVKK